LFKVKIKKTKINITLLQEAESVGQQSADLRQRIAQYHELLNRLDPLKRTVPEWNQKKATAATTNRGAATTPSSVTARRGTTTSASGGKKRQLSRRRSSSSSLAVTSPPPPTTTAVAVKPLSANSSVIKSPVVVTPTAVNGVVNSGGGSVLIDLNSCQLCGRTEDQHLLAHCDVCR
jgi:hypothetical protein